MTLVELVMALILLVAFLGVYVAVTEFTQRFLGESETRQPGVASSGMLVDQYELQVGMDLLAESLAHASVSRENVSEYISQGCTHDPFVAWQALGKAYKFPNDYRICLRSSSLVESPLQDLVSKDPKARPGIYIIQALPEDVSATRQPARRLFCRPKPFC
jgi:hypothetical protein